VTPRPTAVVPAMTTLEPGPRPPAPPARAATATAVFDVLVVEHEPLTRAAVCDLIERHPRMRVAATATSVASAVEILRDGQRPRPAVAIVDLFLPDGDACGLACPVAGHPSAPGIIVLTDFATASAAAVCRSVGILTCLSKSIRPESLVAASLAAAERRSWHGPGVVAAGAEPLLSFLQTQVLAEVASGDSNDAIARTLGYSVNYIKDVVVTVRSQLGARDRAHAASLGVALRMVKPTSDGRFAPALPNVNPGANAHQALAHAGR
jgi:DNA-binding NarL/FixJ family response regulator